MGFLKIDPTLFALSSIKHKIFFDAVESDTVKFLGSLFVFLSHADKKKWMFGFELCPMN